MSGKNNELIIFVLQILAHECTKTSIMSYTNYNYVHNIIGKVAGCCISAYVRYLRPDNRQPNASAHVDKHITE